MGGPRRIVNRIELHPRPIEDLAIGDWYWELQTLIDGRDLVDLVAAACGNGGYRGLRPPNVLPPSLLWFPPEEWAARPEWRVDASRSYELNEHLFADRVAVLRCSCADLGCDSIIARIRATEGRIVWSGLGRARGGAPVSADRRLRPGHEWRTDRLDELVFDRDQYVEALAAATREWARIGPTG